MIAVRLVHLIEKHSEELTEELLHKFQTSPRTRAICGKFLSRSSGIEVTKSYAI